MKTKNFFTKQQNYKITMVATLFFTALLFVGCGITQKSVTKKEQDDYANAELNYLGTKKKELKENGWKYYDDGRTLDLALLDFRRDSKGKRTIVGHVTSCEYDCLLDAQEMAQGFYAAGIIDKVKAKIQKFGFNLQGVSKTEFNGIIKAFEKNATVEIGRVLKSSYSVYKEEGGTRNFKTYFIVDEEAAHIARKRALARAIEEVGIGKKIGEEISNYINN